MARSTDIVEKAKSAVNLAYALSKLQKPVLVMNANLITAEVAALSDSISLAAAVSLKEKSW